MAEAGRLSGVRFKLNLAGWISLAPPSSDEVKKDKKKAKATSQDDFSALPLPPLFEVPTPIQPTKAEALARADGLANGFVLLGVAGNGAEEAWSWVLNGKDEPTLCETSSHMVASS